MQEALSKENIKKQVKKTSIFHIRHWTVDTHVLLYLNLCTRFPVVQIDLLIASGTRSESMFFVLLPMLLWGRVKISEHASAAARACCNYSIPGVKHITEQITEISFNFDVQFVQAAPRPGI